MAPKIERLLVLGGASGMARWLVDRVFGLDPALEIVLADIDPAVEDVARRLRVAATVDAAVIDYRGEEIVGLEHPEDFDAVLVGVPVDAVARVVRCVLPLLRDGVLVFDICSIKSRPIREMLAGSCGRLSIVGTHPLFGPGLNSIVGQPVVMGPTRIRLRTTSVRCDMRSNPWARRSR